MILFFQKLKNLNYKLNKGMTVVELIVVLGIFAVLSSVAIFNYGDFQAMVDIKNLGSDIALKIVEAQKLSMNGMWNSLADSDWEPSYGVYFNPSAVLDSDDGIAFNKKFIFFADINNNNGYNGGGEKLDTINITKNNYISSIDKCDDSDCFSPVQITNPLSVAFKRPDSSAIFYYTGAPLPSGPDYIKITVVSPKGATALIKLYPSGRIQVN